MKLRSISLANFRQHLKSRIEFGAGLTGIIGPNGAGKTTIVEAIAFAIYGSKAIRGKVDDLQTRTLRKGKGKKGEEPSVELVLEHDGAIFRIERTVSSASLYNAGESIPLTVGTREVTARLVSIIGMNHDEFVATFFTEQKGLEFLSGKKGVTERERFIVRMMGYDRLEEMQEMLRTDRKEKRSMSAGFEASLGNRDELEQRLTQEKAEIQEVYKNQSEAAKVLLKAETEQDAMKSRMLRLEDQRQRHQKLADEIQNLSIRLDERTTRLSMIERELTNERIRLSDGSDSSQEHLGAQIETSEARILELDARIGAGEADLSSREAAHRESVTQARLNSEAIRGQLQALNERERRISKLDKDAACPTCGQELGASYEHACRQVEAEKEALENELIQREEKLKEISQIPENLIALNSDLAVLKQDLQVRRKELEAFRATLASRTRLIQLESEFAVAQKERTTLEKEIEVLAERIKDVRFSQDEYTREKGSFDAAQRLMEVARLQKVRLDGEVKTKEALISRTEEEIRKYTEKELQLKKLNQELRVMDASDEVLIGFRRHINTLIRPRLAELAGEYLADLTDGRYVAIDLGADFTPTVVEDGSPKPVISGGEEDILNLCMRIALSHMLAERAGRPLSLLILDEVFGSLDEGRRGNVLGLLEKLGKRFEQILVITHLDDVKEGVRHIVYVDYEEESGTASVGEPVEEAMAINI